MEKTPREIRAPMADRDPMRREIVAARLAAIRIQTDIAADGVEASELAMRITYDIVFIATQLPIPMPSMGKSIPPSISDNFIPA